MPQKTAKQSNRFAAVKRPAPKIRTRSPGKRKGALAFSGQNIDAEVWNFCVKHHLSAHVPLMLGEISRHFCPAGSPLFTVVCDPETDEQYLRVAMTVAGTIAEVADSYDRYVTAWTQSAPTHQSDTLRLSLTVV